MVARTGGGGGAGGGSGAAVVDLPVEVKGIEVVWITIGEGGLGGDEASCGRDGEDTRMEFEDVSRAPVVAHGGGGGRGPSMSRKGGAGGGTGGGAPSAHLDTPGTGDERMGTPVGRDAGGIGPLVGMVSRGRRGRVGADDAGKEGIRLAGEVQGGQSRCVGRFRGRRGRVRRDGRRAPGLERGGTDRLGFRTPPKPRELEGEEDGTTVGRARPLSAGRGGSGGAVLWLFVATP